MQIGEVIREYRKRKNMTQQEMANRLGVTAPAVNKWENGNSQPDIMLLAPISRLLGVTLDTLLSFSEDLTAEEVNNIVYEVNDKLKKGTYEEAFLYGKEKIEQYPNCEQLIWQTAMMLDAWRLTKGIPDSWKYDDYINECYKCALDSKDENLRNCAADSLFQFYLRKEEYTKAEEYLAYISIQNPDRKRKQALIYSKTNRINEAYKAYEELLYSGYQMMNLVFYNIYTLAMREDNKKKANIIVDKQRDLANIFEMGKYHEASCKLDLATAEKDVGVTIDTMEEMLASIESICDFTKSTLYEHMEFKGIEDKFITKIHKDLMSYFRDEETFNYMKKNERWKELVSSKDKKNVGGAEQVN